MPALRRPDGGDLLAPLTIVGIYLYHAHVLGNPPSGLEGAFMLALFVLVGATSLVEGLLASPAYPLIGGGLTAVFYLVRFSQRQDIGSAFGVCAGVLFGSYGLYQWVTSSAEPKL
jgi:putative oxidoreductase